MRGRFDKKLFVFGGDLVAHLVIIFINIVNNARQPRIHAPAQHGQQNAVELLHGFGGAIERAHQLFAFDVAFVAVQPHVFGYLALQVENQPVFFAAGGEVQINADFGQLLVAVHQQSGFGAGDDALLNERVHIGFKPLRFGQPQQGVDIAQAAGAGFYIRLEHRARALRLGMALLHFHKLGFHKSSGVALQAQTAQHLLGHHMAAADKACFEKSGVAGDVVCRAGAQFFDAAHFNCRRQLHIPQALHKKRDLLLLELIKRLGRHNGQIQIGIRIHFIAPEAAGGQEAQAAGTEYFQPQRTQCGFNGSAIGIEKHHRLAVVSVGSDGLLLFKAQILGGRLDKGLHGGFQAGKNNGHKSFRRPCYYKGNIKICSVRK